jgi:hypothetical protein
MTTETTGVDAVDGYDLGCQDLIKYALALLDGMEPYALARVEHYHQRAVVIARAFRDGLVDADGITELGHALLADLYNAHEGGGCGLR